MKCECGRFSLDPVCSYCLTERRTPVAAPAGPSVVIPRVEREGLFCPCGEPRAMVAEVGRWVDPNLGLRSRLGMTEFEPRLLWHRCVACGGITRETLVPAAI